MELREKIAQRIMGHLPISDVMSVEEHVGIIAADILAIPEIAEAFAALSRENDYSNIYDEPDTA